MFEACKNASLGAPGQDYSETVEVKAGRFRGLGCHVSALVVRPRGLLDRFQRFRHAMWFMIRSDFRRCTVILKVKVK